MVSSVRGRPLPIGIDVGTHLVRMAQLEQSRLGYRLWASGLFRIPDEMPRGTSRWRRCLAERIRTLRRSESFQGRECILSLPGADVTVHHVRVPDTWADRIQSVLHAELEQVLDYPLRDAVIRQVPVDTAQGRSGGEREIIAVCVHRRVLGEYLATAESAKLEVAGVSIGPCATVRCFSRLHTATPLAERPVLYVDLGATSVGVCLGVRERLLFSRCISIDAVPEPVGDQGPAEPLAEEIGKCLRYFESLFPAQRVERMVFLGGGAHNLASCRALAQHLKLPAHVGDPLRDVGPYRPHCHVATPSPEWSVALGLGLGE